MLKRLHNGESVPLGLLAVSKGQRSIKSGMSISARLTPGIFSIMLCKIEMAKMLMNSRWTSLTGLPSENVSQVPVSSVLFHLRPSGIIRLTEVLSCDLSE